MSNALLGRLEKVELQVAWENAADFTPWLTQDDNLRQLSEVLGMHLERVPQEQKSGPFRGDVLCREKDAVEEHWVMFENELQGSTDLRLGRLLTHAAGMDRVSVVWIAAGFSEEHRRALDWLNRVTHDRCRFYGVQLELWRINYSPAAPTFTVVCHPPEHGQPAELTQDERVQLDYWTAFAEVLEKDEGALTLSAPKGKTWASFPLDKPGFDLWAFVNAQERRIGMVLETFGGHAKAHFHLLRQEKDAIEAEMGEALEWDERPGQKGAGIMLRRFETDPTDRADWGEQHAWLAQRLQRFHSVLGKRVEALDATDYFRIDDEPDLSKLVIPAELLNLDFTGST